MYSERSVVYDFSIPGAIERFRVDHLVPLREDIRVLYNVLQTDTIAGTTEERERYVKLLTKEEQLERIIDRLEHPQMK